MRKITKAYRVRVQKTINSQPKGDGYTTAKIFPAQWAKYDKEVADGFITKKEGVQKKRDLGRAFSNAVRAGEYQNITYTGKNKQKASTFRIS